jgi:hypothetical protein
MVLCPEHQLIVDELIEGEVEHIIEIPFLFYTVTYRREKGNR